MRSYPDCPKCEAGIKHVHDRQEALDALQDYQDNAAVNYPGPQLHADNAMTRLKPHLLHQEHLELTVARGHSTFVGLGRGELDWVCKKVRARLIANR